MKKKYLEACAETGLSKDEMRGIENLFDAEKKRFKYQSQKIKKMGISKLSLDDESMVDLVDEKVNVEAELLYKEEVRIILGIIRSFRPSDQEFLLDYFYVAEESVSQLARMHNVTRRVAETRINRLIKEMREEYFRINPTGETEIFKK